MIFIELNKYYNKLNQNETKNIKNYVITFIQSKYIWSIIFNVECETP